ncbi:SpoIIE family protein phosphatase [Chakrabartyella piscis]|uniref:SpoIIE family protein phosphatase n=1 Tax=Chakrabartyella piscis TaxID=2918914 RepID=UPI002958BD51|nr:SpoIIE family protein phosphatase [Chakrabartyella piscis]
MEKTNINLEKGQLESYIQQRKFTKGSGLQLLKTFGTAILIGTLGVLFGHITLVQLLHPMGMVFLSFFFGEKLFFWFAWVGVAIGSLQILPTQSWAILTSSAAIQMTLHRHLQRDYTLRKSLVSGFAMCLSGVFYAFSQGGLTFFFALAAVETALVILLSLMGQKALLYLWQRNSRNIPTKEEVYSLCFLGACCFCGASAISSPIVQEGVVAAFVAYWIGFCALRGGCGSASAVGMIFGFILYLGGGIPLIWFITFAVSGLVGGIFQNFGKIPIATGLLLTPLIFLFYHDGLPIAKYLSMGWMVGIICFLCTPKSFLANYSRVLWEESQWKHQYLWKKEMLQEELHSYAKAFKSLAKNFQSDAIEATKIDIPALVNELTDSVCKGCGLAQYCWKEDVQHTYPMVASTLAQEHPVNTISFPMQFQESCVRLDAFCEKSTRILELQRHKEYWSGKLLENRQLMGSQMSAVGEIIENIGQHLETTTKFHEEQAKEILEACKSEGLSVEHVRVTENDMQQRKQVQIAFDGCNGLGVCRQQILHLVEDVLHCKMTISSNCICPQKADTPCLLTYLEEPPYILTTATAYLPASDTITGDASSVLYTESGGVLMALSDGMGKGAGAAKESIEAIELLEQFMEAGFDTNLAVQLINSALLFGSGGDTYATLDICHMDLFTGVGEFIKMGAVASYIYRGERLVSVETHSLPAGILQQVEVIKRAFTFKDGDLIFMMTDGITDIFGGEHELESWLKKRLHKNPMSNPRDLADLVLKGAKKILLESPSAKERADDMMVLVGRFWKHI